MAPTSSPVCLEPGPGWEGLIPRPLALALSFRVRTHTHASLAALLAPGPWCSLLTCNSPGRQPRHIPSVRLTPPRLRSQLQTQREGAPDGATAWRTGAHREWQNQLGTSSNRVNQTALLPALQPFPIRESKITIFTASAAKPALSKMNSCDARAG